MVGRTVYPVFSVIARFNKRLKQLAKEGMCIRRRTTPRVGYVSLMTEVFADSGHEPRFVTFDELPDAGLEFV